jgi:hypothetical protein
MRLPLFKLNNMDYKEIRQTLEEIGISAQHMGTYAQDGQCLIYDDDTNQEVETDVIGMLKSVFGKVTIAETSYFHDGYECWCIYSFHDHDVHMKYSSYFSSYDTTEWEDSSCEEVIPEQKMVTVFSAKK